MFSKFWFINSPHPNQPLPKHPPDVSLGRVPQGGREPNNHLTHNLSRGEGVSPLKYLIALIIGHFTVFKHIFKRPVTLEYPEKKAELNEKFRGEHALCLEKCTACGTCQRVCPSFGTIEIEKEKEKDESGKFHPKSYIIDLNNCIIICT